MFYPGLVSVSFRKNSIDEIISECKKCGLTAIEWGSDVHVPQGNIENAEIVAQKCRTQGISCPSYGSYFKLGINNPAEIDDYINIAEILGATEIRIWGGNTSPEKTDAATYSRMISDGKIIAEKAEKRGIGISLEYHIGTITESYESALKFIDGVNRDNFRTYWQPNQYITNESNLEAASKMAAYITNIHVFNWHGDLRLPLAESIPLWKKYLSVIDREHYLFLEFVPDGQIKSLCAEAESLQKIIS